MSVSLRDFTLSLASILCQPNRSANRLNNKGALISRCLDSRVNGQIVSRAFQLLSIRSTTRAPTLTRQHDSYEPTQPKRHSGWPASSGAPKRQRTNIIIITAPPSCLEHTRALFALCSKFELRGKDTKPIRCAQKAARWRSTRLLLV